MPAACDNEVEQRVSLFKRQGLGFVYAHGVQVGEGVAHCTSPDSFRSIVIYTGRARNTIERVEPSYGLVCKALTVIPAKAGIQW